MDGVVDESEMPANPGELYNWSAFPKLETEAFQFATVDDKIGKDKWGATISGYAPIHTSDGRAVATIGIDMSANDFIRSTRNLFSPVAFLLVLFAAVSIGSGSVLFLWRRRVELLQKLEIERSGLLRLAFHQLGGPLTIISWSIEELEQEGPASIQRPIANIQEGVTRLMGILKTLKDADQVHAGKLDYKPELISLSSILEKVVKEAGAKLAMHRQTVKLDLDPSIIINLDAKLIAGVAQELLTNASDFSPEKSEIVLRSRASGSYATFEVEDHGHGIPKHDLPRIFGEFTRGSNATKYKADGNGLGLYIIKGIVERAGGKISIDSVEGKGTTVTVKLKMA
jgi:signal transduction histidine kinase